jgi:antitoxin (DNA-binding transcriptional repressor) of toxin-antitoxin stability system
MDNQSRSPTKTINAGKARVNLGRMLDEVFYKGEQFIIERDGRPMAVVIPLLQLEELQSKSDQARTGTNTGKGNKRQSRKGKA